ncbi:MAG: hypothetical protein LBG95_02975 [Treponema sp.]|jgi:hypothetical protein|nr:hypothetical protein [Treponema sp.]
MKKHLWKIAAVLAALALVFAFAACKNGDDPGPSGPDLSKPLGDNASYQEALDILDAIIADGDTPKAIKDEAKALKDEIVASGSGNWGDDGGDFIDKINDLLDKRSEEVPTPGTGGSSDSIYKSGDNLITMVKEGTTLAFDMNQKDWREWDGGIHWGIKFPEGKYLCIEFSSTDTGNSWVVFRDSYHNVVNADDCVIDGGCVKKNHYSPEKSDDMNGSKFFYVDTSEVKMWSKPFAKEELDMDGAHGSCLMILCYTDAAGLNDLTRVFLTNTTPTSAYKKLGVKVSS